MVDFNKLSHVTDALNDPSKRTVTAPKGTPSGKSPLDDLEVREKVADSEKPKVKVMIIDDVQINKIMSLPRDERRKFLSRLSDSQRRRVLSRYRELSKVKDDESATKLAYVNLDSIINNIIYLPDDYHKNLLAQWESVYEIPSEIEQFVFAIKNDDREGMAAHIDEYKAWAEANEIKTDVRLIEEESESNKSTVELPEVSDSVELTPELSEQIVAAAKKDLEDVKSGKIEGETVWDRADETIAHFVLEHDLDYVQVQELYTDAWNSYMNEVLGSLTDSVTDLTAKLNERKVLDSVLDEFKDDESPIEDEVSPLEELSEALLAFASGDSTLLEQFASVKSENDVEADTEDNIEDSTSNQRVAENINWVENEDGTVSLVGKVDGNIYYKGTPEECRTALREMTDSVKSVDGKIADLHAELESLDEQDPKRQEILDKIQALQGSEKQELTCPIQKAEESAKTQEQIDNKNAKELAILIKEIAGGADKEGKSSVMDSLIDSLIGKVPALSKFNFRISDCGPCVSEVPAPASTMINAPMSREEYYSLYPATPSYFDDLLAKIPAAQCPSCNEYEVRENGICVNPNGISQMYYPCGITLQEIADILAVTAPEDYVNVINEHCCPMEEAMALAALTNNLSVIDNNFYKRFNNSDEWCFDVVPCCIAAYTDKPGCIVRSTADSAISLFGFKFEIK